jgi:hypothetical protein
MPSNSLPINFFGPQTPKASITDLSSSAINGNGRWNLFLNFVCALALSALTPSNS